MQIPGAERLLLAPENDPTDVYSMFVLFFVVFERWEAPKFAEAGEKTIQDTRPQKDAFSVTVEEMKAFLGSLSFEVSWMEEMNLRSASGPIIICERSLDKPCFGRNVKMSSGAFDLTTK